MILRIFRCLLVAMVSVSVCSGCSSFGIRNGVPYFSKQEQWEPEEKDKWASVGEQGRGNRALEDEYDPIKDMVMSREAQNIERNLGYK
jgi:hypothetical protein